MNHTIADFHGFGIEVVLDRVAVVSTMRLGAERPLAESGHQMAMDLRCGVRRNQNAFLLGKVGDPRRLREACVAR